MKPDKLTVHDLFQKERQYLVPLYQRSYVWTRDDQWEPLWEDIERQAEACLNDPDKAAKRSHFLGAIVLNVEKIVGNSVARSEIIDGQQRLTTLQLFLAALRDVAVSKNATLAAKLTHLTVNEHEKPGSDATFKVWPTNADRAVFKKIMNAGSPDAVLRAFAVSKDASAPRLAQAYLYFARVITSFVGIGDADSANVRISGLFQALRIALQLVVIELEDSDDPQIIFETLNARGQPLLPSDLIRNYLFLRAASNPKVDADDLYNEYWRQFDDLKQEPVNGELRFWHVPERQGRLLRPRIDLFMFHYLVMKMETDLNIGQLFRDFRDWWDEPSLSVEHLLADIKSHSAIFADLISPKGNDRLGVFARRIKTLDTSTLFPLLLYLLALPADRLPIEHRDCILDDLESWLVRRFVCQLTNKNYNHFFVSLLSKVKSAPDDEPLDSVVRKELSRSADPTLVWPDDTEFRSGWLSKPIYVKSRIERCNMVLRALEERLHNAKNERVLLPSGLTVEHLLPQKGALSDYPYSPVSQLEPGETPERYRSRLIHTIGNLTLLTQELNSSVSNGPFPEKALAIRADSDLRLNAWLRDGAIPDWSEDTIVKRGDKLFSTAASVWPCPPDLQDARERAKAEVADDEAGELSRHELRRRFWSSFSQLVSTTYPTLPPIEPRPSASIRVTSGVAHVGFEVRFALRDEAVAVDIWFWRAASMPLWRKYSSEPIRINSLIPSAWSFAAVNDHRARMTIQKSIPDLPSDVTWPQAQQWLADTLTAVFTKLVPILKEDLGSVNGTAQGNAAG